MAKVNILIIDRESGRVDVGVFAEPTLDLTDPEGMTPAQAMAAAMIESLSERTNAEFARIG